MSEMLMFNRKEVGDKIYRARYSQSLITASYQYLPKSLDDRYVKGHYGHNIKPAATSLTLATNPIFLSKASDNFALSLALGLNPGVDATFRIIPKYYTTFSIDGYGGTQIIIQKRLFNKPTAGLSFGVFYKNQHHNNYEDTQSDCGFCPSFLNFNTNEVGIRSVFLSHASQTKSQGFLYFVGSLGYDVNMQIIVFQIGCS
ncbi:MAG TPA: hypothetical protein VJ991_10160, partial [Balneolales bacterium]|nr:hypothetical protein [Balneolales bacterium]